MLSCYFPVSFTPPPGDGRAITRGQLAAELQATLAAAPAFAPHVVPLAIEKLGSTVKCACRDKRLRGGGVSGSAAGARPASHCGGSNVGLTSVPASLPSGMQSWTQWHCWQHAQ